MGGGIGWEAWKGALLLRWGECLTAHLPVWLSHGQRSLCSYLSTCLHSGAPQHYLCSSEFLPRSWTLQGLLDIIKYTYTHTHRFIDKQCPAGMTAAKTQCILNLHSTATNPNAAPFVLSTWCCHKAFTADLDISLVAPKPLMSLH